MSDFLRTKENSRQYLIEKRLFVSVMFLTALMMGFYAVGFDRFAAVCLIGVIAIGAVVPLMRGMRLILRVLTNWLPGLTIVTARYESWLDAEMNV